MQNYAKHETITIEGVDYVSPAACSFGDYGGNGSVGLSNIRAIVKDAGESVFETSFDDIRYATEGSYFPFESEMELRAAIKAKRKPLVLHVTGGFSSETVYILRHSKLAHETLESLADYPSLDDDGSSSIEMEWQSEAWSNYIESDLNRAAWPEDDLPGYAEMSDDDKYEAYRFAMEKDNCYPEPEYNGVYVDIERIKDTYRQTIERMLSGETIDAIHHKQWPAFYPAPAANAESA